MKRGTFEEADGGTLFLDEVADMSLATQAKVLRVLQEQRFSRVGGTRTIDVDVRVISASNKDLTDAITRGTFREDLFYRLNVIPLHVPPLRERREDIPALAEHFLREIAADQGLKPKTVHPQALDTLMQYQWPGNVRELRNTIERLLIMVPGSTIQSADVASSLGGAGRSGGATTPSVVPDGLTLLKDARAAFEREYIARSLRAHDFNVSKTAEALGLERSHLHRKIKMLGIDVRPVSTGDA
jgi:two-component system nitrogen regulation response regulator NtrX